MDFITKGTDRSIFYIKMPFVLKQRTEHLSELWIR